MKTPLLFLLSALVWATACSNQANSDIDAAKTQEVLDHHWTAFKDNDLEAVMADYTEVLITPDTTYRGLEAIRANFIRAFELFPKAQNPLRLNKSVVDRDLAYILWQAKTTSLNLSYATDTFIIRNGKIIRQTYAGVAE